MTTTACLPECRCMCPRHFEDHPRTSECLGPRLYCAPGCPNGPRVPQAKVVCICSPNCFGCECNCHYSIRPAPQAEDGGKVHGDDCVDDCNGCTCWCHPKPAPAHEPKQGSEEPIDWDAAKASSESWAKGRPLPHDLKCTPAQETLGRAYLALRAENERLYGKVQGHGLVLAERDSLRAEVAKLRKFVSEAMHEADAEKARADKAEQRVREIGAEIAASLEEVQRKTNGREYVHSADVGRAFRKNWK